MQIWPQVKAENAHLSSVCELGAIVGSLWRDLDPTQKQEYNDLYAKDKVTVTIMSSSMSKCKIYVIFIALVLYTVSEKTSHLRLAIILTYTIHLR